jgi:hypothetical protein
LRVPRVDLGAAFAEHFVFLTDLFVRGKLHVLGDVLEEGSPQSEGAPT